MKAATSQEIKKELQHLSAAKLTELCLRLARFKKENKELLSYLLFEEHDEQDYVASVKTMIDDEFAEVKVSNSPYLLKKSCRKILRQTNKYIRYTSVETTEVELLMNYCEAFRTAKIPLDKSTALTNIYLSQIKKLEKLIKNFHEDLQYDYLRQLDSLRT
jgi:hypothetical protein